MDGRFEPFEMVEIEDNAVEDMRDAFQEGDLPALFNDAALQVDVALQVAGNAENAAVVAVNHQEMQDEAVNVLVQQPMLVGQPGIAVENDPNNPNALPALIRNAEEAGGAQQGCLGRLSQKSKITLVIGVSGLVIGLFGAISPFAIIQYLKNKDSLPQNASDKIKALLEQWRALPDEQFWKSYNDCLAKAVIPQLTGIPGQMLTMNIIIELSGAPPAPGFSWTATQMLACINLLVAEAQKYNADNNHDYHTGAMYMKASQGLTKDGLSNGTPLPRGVVAQVLQMALGNILMELQNIKSETKDVIDQFIQTLPKNNDDNTTYWSRFADTVHKDDSGSHDLSQVSQQIYFLTKTASAPETEPWTWDDDQAQAAIVEAMVTLYRQYGNTNLGIYRNFMKDPSCQYKGTSLPKTIAAKLLFMAVNKALAVVPDSTLGNSTHLSPRMISGLSALASSNSSFSTSSSGTMMLTVNNSNSDVPNKVLSASLAMASSLVWLGGPVVGPIGAAVVSLVQMFTGSSGPDLFKQISDALKDAVDEIEDFIKAHDLTSDINACTTLSITMSDRFAELTQLKEDADIIEKYKKIEEDAQSGVETMPSIITNAENLFNNQPLETEQDYTLKKQMLDVIILAYSNHLFALNTLVMVNAALYGLYATTNQFDEKQAYASKWAANYVAYIDYLGYGTNHTDYIGNAQRYMREFVESVLGTLTVSHTPLEWIREGTSVTTGNYTISCPIIGKNQRFTVYGPRHDYLEGRWVSGTESKDQFLQECREELKKLVEPYLDAININDRNTPKSDTQKIISNWTTALSQLGENPGQNPVIPLLAISVTPDTPGEGKKVIFRIAIRNCSGHEALSEPKTITIKSNDSDNSNISITIPKEQLILSGPSKAVTLIVYYRLPSFKPDQRDVLLDQIYGDALDLTHPGTTTSYKVNITKLQLSPMSVGFASSASSAVATSIISSRYAVFDTRNRSTADTADNNCTSSNQNKNVHSVQNQPVPINNKQTVKHAAVGQTIVSEMNKMAENAQHSMELVSAEMHKAASSIQKFFRQHVTRKEEVSKDSNLKTSKNSFKVF